MNNDVLKEINKNFIATLILIILIGGLSCYLFGPSNFSFKLNLSEKVLKIMEYIFSAFILIQIFAVYNAIKNILFNQKAVNKIAKGLQATDNKYLKTYSPEEATILTGINMIFGQNFAIVVYSIILGFAGADIILVLNLFLAAIIILCISWFAVKRRIVKYFSS
jgi:hypothetical protein